MSSRNLLNGILLLVVVGLITLIIFEPGKKEATPIPRLTSLNPDDIKHIIIRRTSDKHILEFKRVESGWSMLQPYRLAANNFRINSIFKLAETVSFSKNKLQNLDLNKFGLDDPTVTITFNHKTRISFGNNKSLKNLRYVQIDNQLHMITDSFYYQLMAKAESFIDHQLLPENSKILELELPSVKIKNNNGKWDVSPEPDEYSADSINQLLSQWLLSQAYDIKYSGSNKISRSATKIKPDIRIKLSNNKLIRFKLISNKEHFVLHNIDSGIQYILALDRKDKLLKIPDVENKNE